MAKIGLSEGFTLIPKGTHVFKIGQVQRGLRQDGDCYAACFGSEAH